MSGLTHEMKAACRPYGVFWCLHCERVQRLTLVQDERSGEWYEFADHCSFSDCMGHAGDLWRWSTIVDPKGQRPPGWPSHPPFDGARLPLYPPPGWSWGR